MTTKAGPLRLLAAAVQRGEWLPDRGQQHTATLLQAVYEGTSRGTYLHGPVGSGKTALMDLLVRSCDAGQVRRLHFHELMGHVHRELHRGAAVPAIGAELVAAAPLLAVDEMQLTDIADAAIVSRLVAAHGMTGPAHHLRARPSRIGWKSGLRQPHAPPAAPKWFA